MISRVLPTPRRLDLIVLGSALALAALGILFVASTTGGGRLQGLATRQAIWIAVGLLGLVGAVLLDYRTLLKVSFALYLASLAPLLYLLVFGQRIANVRSWIRFGSLQFQPAELAKITTALLVAYLFENEDDARLRLSAFVKLGAIVGLPFLLVFAQPDLGLALTFLPLLIVGFFFGRLPARGWIAIFIAVAVLAGAGWLFLRDYQKQRIETFLNPDHDFLNPWASKSTAGFQAVQGQIALGSGGVLGVGLGKSVQKIYYLPEAQTDFILAVIGEEWGFLGIILVLGLFATLVLRCLTLARVARDRGGVFLILALAGMLFFSVTVNASMMIGLLPTTGIPLPLVSYGGSSIATTFLAIGLILSVDYRRFANA